MSEDDIYKWLKWCENLNIKNTGFVAFLTKMNENGIKADNFGVILSMLQTTIKDDNDDIEGVEQIYQQARNDQFVANYLFNHLKSETLMDIGKTVNNGLLKQECGFNDTLLFLAKLVNNDQFNKTLQETTNECLTKEKKNVEKLNFFKNNLLNSNIWACMTQEEDEEEDAKRG